MVRQTNMTAAAADSCWEDSLENDETCERYLQRQKEKAAKQEDVLSDDDEDEIDDEDSEDEDDDTETASVEEAEDVTAAHDANADDDEDDADAVLADDAETDPEPVAPEDSATQSRGGKMAKTKTGGKTKAEAIREVIAAKQKAGAELRPRDIIEVLQKRGIAVNASQVSITLRAMGVPAITRGGTGAKKKTPAAPAASETEKNRATMKRKAPEALGGTPELDATARLLEAAADFMADAGGYEQAVRLLSMCHRLRSHD